MAGLFSPLNAPAQDEAVAKAVAGSIRLRLEKLTPGQVVEVLHWIDYCPHCGVDVQDPSGKDLSHHVANCSLLSESRDE